MIAAYGAATDILEPQRIYWEWLDARPQSDDNSKLQQVTARQASCESLYGSMMPRG
jgi:hypothetical protein